MNTFIFKTGTRVEIDGRRFRIVRIFADGRVQLESEIDGVLTYSTLDQLHRDYAERRLRIYQEEPHDGEAAQQLGRSLSTFPEPVQKEAIRRKRYLDFFSEFGKFISTPVLLKPLIDECARLINDTKLPSAITAYRWHTKFVRAARDCRALITRNHLKGGTGSRLHPEATQILMSVIDDIYLNTQRHPGTEVHCELSHRINKLNESRSEPLPIPSAATVYRALAGLDKFETMAARMGSRIAQMKFRTSGVRPPTTRILERVEIDHTPLDLFVIDAETGLPLGRPTATFAIDVHSKMPVGMHIGFSGPSIEAVFACLRHALVPKTYIKETYPEIEHDWPCHGLIETLVCDNGLEFHSPELERVAFELGIQIQFCPKKIPYYKGSIERFMKSLNFQFARMWPGHSFAKWFQREDYDPQKEAVVTFDQLMRYMHRWIVDIYAQKIHRGIRKIPYHAWCESANQYPPKLLADLDRLDVALGRTCERTIFHYGFDLHNVRYNCHELLGLRRQHGESVKVDVRYYFDDISVVNVIDPVTKHPIPVPALDQSYAQGLSIEQHRLICAHARAENNGKIDSASIARAKAAIRGIVKEMTTDKLQRQRQRGAKAKGIKQRPMNSSAPSQPQPELVGPLEEVTLQTSTNLPTELPDFAALVFSRLPKSLEL